MGNLAGVLEETARAHPSRTALLHEGGRIDYAALDERCARFAGLLRSQGVGPGDRVAILLPNAPAFVEAYYGTLRLGAVAVPLNALLRSAEVGLRLADSQPRVLVAPKERAPELAETVAAQGVAFLDPARAGRAEPVRSIAARDSGSVAVLLYTSGTSGGAKGAELTHAGLRAVAAFTAGPLLGLSPEDVLLGAAPLAHVFGQSGIMNAAVAAASGVVLVPRFEAQAALELMARTATTVFLGVPTMCIALLEAAAAAPAVPQLRVTHTGGAPLPAEILQGFRARFGGEVLEGYGLTETSGGIVTHRLGQAVKAGSVGTPADGTEIRLVDLAGRDVREGEVGEVLARGPGVMRGYWRNPVATRDAIDAAGFLSTGDMGYRDEDGYLFLVDRKKDVILRGGYTVYPREVEEALYAHPDVLEAAVVGVPDSTQGEEIVGLVVPRPGAAADPAEIRQFVRGRIAAYKYPRLVVVVERLPRGPSGKILKREIDRRALRQELSG